MVVMHWQPIVELGTLQRQLDQVFDDLTHTSSRHKGTGSAWMPPIEMKDSDTALTLKVLLPGIHQDDLDIQVTRESVLIAGEYRQNPQPGEGCSRSEFNYGQFRRVVSLSTPVDNTKVSARLEHGVLTLTLPKAPEVLNQVVKISLD